MNKLQDFTLQRKGLEIFFFLKSRIISIMGLQQSIRGRAEGNGPFAVDVSFHAMAVSLSFISLSKSQTNVNVGPIEQFVGAINWQFFFLSLSLFISRRQAFFVLNIVDTTNCQFFFFNFQLGQNETEQDMLNMKLATSFWLATSVDRQE